MHSKEASLECCAITAEHPFGNADDKELVCFQYAEEREPDQRVRFMAEFLVTPHATNAELMRVIFL